MFDQIKMGVFLSNVRKEKNLTQKQLAEKVRVSDKSVSKWETGKAMPDASVMMELCGFLEITVNELLSGEYISTENYSGRAEENMMNLMKETENERKRSWCNTLLAVIGSVILIGFLVALIYLTRGNLTWFLDIPSFTGVFGIGFLILLISGQSKDFGKGILLSTSAKKAKSAEKMDYVKAYVALKYGAKAFLLAGIICALIGLVGFLGQISDMSSSGPIIAITILSLMYGLLFFLLLLPIQARVEMEMRTFL